MKTVKALFFKFLFFVSAFYFLLVALLFVMQRQFLYVPDTSVPDISRAPWATQISVQTQDGLKLYAWWRAPIDSNTPTILFFHGNGANIENRIDKALPYIQAGFGLLLAEYRGYGGNPGKPTEYGLYKDGHAYMAWLNAHANISTNDIVLYGESLGSGVAVHLATEYDVKGLVLDVPFDSAMHVARHHYPYVVFLKHLMRDHYRNDLKITQVNAPLLIGLAGRDTVTPPSHGQRLYDLASDPKTLKVYPNATHADLYVQGLTEDSITFIKSLDLDQN